MPCANNKLTGGFFRRRRLRHRPPKLVTGAVCVCVWTSSGCESAQRATLRCIYGTSSSTRAVAAAAAMNTFARSDARRQHLLVSDVRRSRVCACEPACVRASACAPFHSISKADAKKLLAQKAHSRTACCARMCGACVGLG